MFIADFESTYLRSSSLQNSGFSLMTLSYRYLSIYISYLSFYLPKFYVRR